MAGTLGPQTTSQKELLVEGLPALTCAAEGEQEVLKQLHSAKPTGGSIGNIWVQGGQGSFCLQAVHWPDTSPRFSLGFFYIRGGSEGGKKANEGDVAGGIQGGKGVCFFCRQEKK